MELPYRFNDRWHGNTLLPNGANERIVDINVNYLVQFRAPLEVFANDSQEIINSSKEILKNSKVIPKYFGVFTPLLEVIQIFFGVSLKDLKEIQENLGISSTTHKSEVRD